MMKTTRRRPRPYHGPWQPRPPVQFPFLFGAKGADTLRQADLWASFLEAIGFTVEVDRKTLCVYITGLREEKDSD